MNLFCPGCTLPIDMKDFHHGHDSFTFSYYAKDNEYLIDISIGDKQYGLDSNARLKKTWLFLLNNNDANFVKLLTLDHYTPIPKNKEAIKQNIQRLLNLKAFF